MAARRLTILAAYLAAMAMAFRATILSGFDLGFGDRADALIEIALLEHWRNALAGAAVWNQPLYFYPWPDTLGYNDGYFLSGLIYAGWRLWFDPFVADTLVAATYKSIGFFAAYALVARSLRWEWPVALLIATLFTIANGMAVQAVHAQLQSIALLPVMMILVIACVRACGEGRRGQAALTGAATAMLAAAWLLTAYYMAWFTLFFAGVFVCCWCRINRLGPAAIAALIGAHRFAITITAAAFAVCIVPFLIVYLPSLRQTGGHGYMISYLVTPLDPLNVGPGNYVWGWLWRGAGGVFGWIAPPGSHLPDRFLRGEHETGFPVALFVLAVLAARHAVRRGDAAESPVLAAFAWAILIGWALTLQLWVASPWGVVHFAVPGAKGIRVVLRFQLFLILPLLLLVFAVHRARAMQLARSAPLAAVACASFLFVEQLNAEPVAELSRSVQLRDLIAIPPPPRACRAFYVVAARKTEIPSRNPGSPIHDNPGNAAKYLANVDALFLAQYWRVPTINGFATFNPPDWNFAEPLARDYDRRVAVYARAHRLHAICRLDVRSLSIWSRPIG